MQHTDRVLQQHSPYCGIPFCTVQERGASLFQEEAKSQSGPGLVEAALQRLNLECTAMALEQAVPVGPPQRNT